MKNENLELAIIGLGYVGLPLAVEFGKKRKVIGFDIDKERIQNLKNGYDSTKESSTNDLLSAKNLIFTSSIEEIKNCNCFIVCVPTPIDSQKQPDLTPLISASKKISTILKKNDIVIYESTVYPGATEEVCVPVLENSSNLKFNIDFFCGYSPERINPGDKDRGVSDIVKVTSGSNKEIANIIDRLYAEIIIAGTHMAPSIRVAEAAKVIENTQRDVNIALINELAIIFDKLNIDTKEVLSAAETKWNVLPFRPGIVGGHCIGVDPYYLTFKAKSVGYHPEIILSGRALNDDMGSYIANKTIKTMARKGINIFKSKVLILGLAFKENCPDIRNTRVTDIKEHLEEYSCEVDIYDPLVHIEDAIKHYNIRLIADIKNNTYDAIIIAVAHEEFKSMGIKKIKDYGKNNAVIFDLKYLFEKQQTDIRL